MRAGFAKGWTGPHRDVVGTKVAVAATWVSSNFIGALGPSKPFIARRALQGFNCHVFAITEGKKWDGKNKIVIPNKALR
jgi:hypothetical protein